MKRIGLIALGVLILVIVAYFGVRAYQANRAKAEAVRQAEQAALQAEQAKFEGFEELELSPGSYLVAKGTASSMAVLTEISLSTTMDGTINGLLFLGQKE